MPFKRNEDAGRAFAAEGQDGPTIRENVQAGTDVIDLAAMRAELEANPEARRRL